MMKKENWVKLFEVLGAGAFLFFVIVMVINVYFNSTSYICSHNPDKCVCTHEKESYNKYGNSQSMFNSMFNSETIDFPNEVKFYSEKIKQHNYIRWCSNFRLKNPSELLIESCNNNPREDDKCKCEKQQQVTTSSGCHYYYTPGFECVWNITKSLCERQLNISIQEPLDNLTSICLLAMGLEVANNQQFIYDKCPLVQSQDCYINTETQCTKSHPKTECEKGNPNWMEETRYIESNLPDGCYSKDNIPTIENEGIANYKPKIA